MLRFQNNVSCQETPISFWESFVFSVLTILTICVIRCLIVQLCTRSGNKFSATRPLFTTTKRSLTKQPLTLLMRERKKLQGLKAKVDELWNFIVLPVGAGGGGGTLLLKPYRYVLPNRVGFLCRFGLNTPCPFWSGIGCGFRGNYGVWTYLSFQFQMSKKEREFFSHLIFHTVGDSKNTDSVRFTQLWSENILSFENNLF